MDNCGSCKHYVFKAVSGPSCSLTGKAVSALMQKDCFVPNTDGPDVVTKVCKKCGRTIPVSMFGKAPKNHDGLKSYCHDCENANCRTYRAKRKAARQKARSKVLDAPVVNDLLEKPELPDMTVEQAILVLVSKGFTITLSKPQNP